MSVRVTAAGAVKEIPAQSVTAIIATRFDGGDIYVVLILDNDARRHTYTTTAWHPLVRFELVGIDTIGRVVGPVDVTHAPITVTVQRGHVGTPNRF